MSASALCTLVHSWYIEIEHIHRRFVRIQLFSQLCWSFAGLSANKNKVRESKQNYQKFVYLYLSKFSVFTETCRLYICDISIKHVYQQFQWSDFRCIACGVNCCIVYPSLTFIPACRHTNPPDTSMQEAQTLLK